jgi:hypothetical protein
MALVLHLWGRHGSWMLAAPFVIVMTKPLAVHGNLSVAAPIQAQNWGAILWQLQFAVMFHSFPSIQTVEGMTSS